MKWFILLAVPLLSFFQHPKELAADTIEWSYDRPLTWSDFQAPAQYNTETVASTNTALGVNFHVRNNKLEFDIYCHFNKKKSWGRVKTDYVLQHEQGHFDIAEIYARILYQRLSEYKFSKSYQTELNKIYNSTMEEKSAFQSKYDAETDHSRNKEMQEKWWDEIDELLESTEGWKNYH